MPPNIPTTQWNKFGTDLLKFKEKSYPVVVNYTTNFVDITLLPDKRSATIVTHTKIIFTKYEIPNKVVSDILERIANFLQNNGASNMTHLVLITQNLINKSNETFNF